MNYKIKKTKHSIPWLYTMMMILCPPIAFQIYCNYLNSFFFNRFQRVLLL